MRELVWSCCIAMGIVSLAACSASSQDVGGGGDASDGGAAQQGGAPSTGGGSDGGAADGAGSQGGAGPDNRIDPIALGHAWTYDVEEIGTFALCASGSHTGETVDEVTLDGKDAFEVTNLCTGLGSSFYAVDGDLVEVYYQGTWILALDAPVEDGHTWSNGTSTFTWHDEGSVTVPAGTFDDCWRATQNVDYEAYTIFCRGVGPVHWRSVDLTGNGFDAQLTEKSF